MGCRAPDRKKEKKKHHKLIQQDAEHPATKNPENELKGPGSTPPAPTQAAANGTYFKQGGEPNTFGDSGARAAAGTSRSYGSGWSGVSHVEQDLASSISSDAERISAYSQPRLSSPDPQVRSQAQQYLAQPAQPPAGQEENYDALGLRTNRDVMEKGPEYADNLRASAEAHEQDAKTFDHMADQADAAAAQMEKFNQTLDQRNNNIESVNDQSMTAANKKGGATDPSALAGSKADGNDANGFGANGRTNKFSAPGFGADNSSMAVDAQKGQNANAAGDAFGFGSGKQAGAGVTGKLNGGGGSLYDRESGALGDSIRRGLASADGSGADAKHAKQAGEPKSAFDEIFEAGTKSGQHAKSGEEGGGEADGSGAGNGSGTGHGFTMAGSETDRAVNKLLQGLNGQGADEDRRVFGDIDQTIFSRMTKYLTKAQAEKRVAR